MRATRLTADHEGEVVVFVIGMHLNRLSRVDVWLPIVRSMRRMVGELAADPDSGFLGFQRLFLPPRKIMHMQYWRSFDHLHDFASARDGLHWPAWTEFYQRASKTGAVGIFHETYCVPAGRHETIYCNMPPFGLGRFAGAVPATGMRTSARDRLDPEPAEEIALPPQPAEAAPRRKVANG